MIKTKFDYFDNSYDFIYHPDDHSSLGSINEIVLRNDYGLNQYKDLETVFIDVGANCGVATLILAKQNPKSVVYALEPSPAVFDRLKMNVLENGLDNVVLLNKALVGKAKDYVLLLGHPSVSGANCINSDIDQFKKTQFIQDCAVLEVPAISLDDLVAKYVIKEVELFKIDCEGSEYDIIVNSSCVKTGMFKNLVGEFHNLKYNKETEGLNATQLLEYCRQYIKGSVNCCILDL